MKQKLKKDKTAPFAQEANGKDESGTKAVESKQALGQLTRKPRTLDEVWGFKTSKYNTTDEASYKKSLASMNKVDLQRESIKFELAPNDSRERMIERLMKLFRQYVAGLQTINLEVKKITINEQAAEILGKTRSL